MHTLSGRCDYVTLSTLLLLQRAYFWNTKALPSDTWHWRYRARGEPAIAEIPLSFCYIRADFLGGTKMNAPDRSVMIWSFDIIMYNFHSTPTRTCKCAVVFTTSSKSIWRRHCTGNSQDCFCMHLVLFVLAFVTSICCLPCIFPNFINGTEGAMQRIWIETIRACLLLVPISLRHWISLVILIFVLHWSIASPEHDNINFGNVGWSQRREGLP